MKTLIKVKFLEHWELFDEHGDIKDYSKGEIAFLAYREALALKNMQIVEVFDKI